VVHDDGSGEALYAGGAFAATGGITTTNVARWDGGNWSPLTDAVTGIAGVTTVAAGNDGVEAITAFDDGSGAALFVGGDVTSAGGRPSANIGSYSCLDDAGIFADGFELGDTSGWSAAVPPG
jgi:hypothetical protein